MAEIVTINFSNSKDEQDLKKQIDSLSNMSQEAKKSLSNYLTQTNKMVEDVKMRSKETVADTIKGLNNILDQYGYQISLMARQVGQETVLTLVQHMKGQKIDVEHINKEMAIDLKPIENGIIKSAKGLQNEILVMTEEGIMGAQQALLKTASEYINNLNRKTTDEAQKHFASQFKTDIVSGKKGLHSIANIAKNRISADSQFASKKVDTKTVDNQVKNDLITSKTVNMSKYFRDILDQNRDDYKKLGKLSNKYRSSGRTTDESFEKFRADASLAIWLKKAGRTNSQILQIKSFAQNGWTKDDLKAFFELPKINQVVKAKGNINDTSSASLLHGQISIGDAERTMAGLGQNYSGKARQNLQSARNARPAQQGIKKRYSTPKDDYTAHDYGTYTTTEEEVYDVLGELEEEAKKFVPKNKHLSQAQYKTQLRNYVKMKYGDVYAALRDGKVFVSRSAAEDFVKVERGDIDISEEDWNKQIKKEFAKIIKSPKYKDVNKDLGITSKKNKNNEDIPMSFQDFQNIDATKLKSTAKSKYNELKNLMEKKALAVLDPRVYAHRDSLEIDSNYDGGLLRNVKWNYKEKIHDGSKLIAPGQDERVSATIISDEVIKAIARKSLAKKGMSQNEIDKFMATHSVDVLKGREKTTGYKTVSTDLRGWTRALIDEKVRQGATQGVSEKDIMAQIAEDLNTALGAEGFGSVSVGKHGQLNDSKLKLREMLDSIKDESERVQLTEKFLKTWFNSLKAGTVTDFVEYQKNDDGTIALDDHGQQIVSRSGVKFNLPDFGYNSYALHNARSYDDPQVKAMRNGVGWGIGGYRGLQSLKLSIGAARAMAKNDQEQENLNELEHNLEVAYSNTTISKDKYEFYKELARKTKFEKLPDKVNSNNIIDLSSLNTPKDEMLLDESDYINGKITQEAFNQTVEGKIGAIMNQRQITGDVYIRTPDGGLIFVPSENSAELSNIAKGTSKRIENISDGNGNTRQVIQSDLMMQATGFGSLINRLIDTYYDGNGEQTKKTDVRSKRVKGYIEDYNNRTNEAFQKGGMIYDASTDSHTTSAHFGKSDSYNIHDLNNIYEQYKNAQTDKDKEIYRQQILQMTGGITLSKDNFKKILLTAPKLSSKEEEDEWNKANNGRLKGMYQALRDQFSATSRYKFVDDETLNKWDNKTLAGKIANIVDSDRSFYNGENLAAIGGRFPFSHGEDLKFAGLRVGGNADTVKFGIGLMNLINGDFDGDSLLSFILGVDVKKLREENKEAVQESMRKAMSAAYGIQKTHEQRSQVSAASRAALLKQDEEDWAARGLSLDEQKDLKVIVADKRTAIEAGLAERVGKNKVGQISNIYQNLHNGLVGMKVSTEGNLEGEEAERAMAALVVNSIFEAATQEAISSKKILEKGSSGAEFTKYANNLTDLMNMFDPTKTGEFSQKDLFALLDKMGVNAGFGKGEGSAYFSRRIGSQIAMEMLQAGDSKQAEENLWNLISTSGYTGSKADFQKLLPKFDSNKILDQEDYLANKEEFENLFTREIVTNLFTKLDKQLTGKAWKDTWNRGLVLGKNAIVGLATTSSNRPGTEKIINVEQNSESLESGGVGLGVFINGVIEATKALQEFTGALNGSGGGGGAGGGGRFKTPFEIAKKLAEETGKQSNIINPYNSWSASSITNALNPNTLSAGQQFFNTEYAKYANNPSKYNGGKYFGYESAEELKAAIGSKPMAADAGHVSEDVANVFMYLRNMGADISKYSNIDQVYGSLENNDFKGINGVRTLKDLVKTARTTIKKYNQKEQALQNALGDLYGDSTIDDQIQRGISQSGTLATILQQRGYNKKSFGTETISAGLLGNQGTVTRADFSTLLNTDSFGNKRNTFAFFDYKNKDKKSLGVNDVIQGVLNYNNLETIRQLAHQEGMSFEDFEKIPIYQQMKASWERYNPGEHFDGKTYFNNLRQAEKVEGYVAQGDSLFKLNIDQASLSRFMQIVTNLMNGNGTLEDYQDEINRLYGQVILPGTQTNPYIGKGMKLADLKIDTANQLQSKINAQKELSQSPNEAEKEYIELLTKEIELLKQKQELIDKAIESDENKVGIDKKVAEDQTKAELDQLSKDEKLGKEAAKLQLEIDRLQVEGSETGVLDQLKKKQELLEKNMTAEAASYKQQLLHDAEKKKQLQTEKEENIALADKIKGYKELTKERDALETQLNKVNNQIEQTSGSNATTTAKNPEKLKELKAEIQQQLEAKRQAIKDYVESNGLSTDESVALLENEINDSKKINNLSESANMKVNQYYGLSDEQLSKNSAYITNQLTEKQNALIDIQRSTSNLTDAEKIEAQENQDALIKQISLLQEKKELIEEAIEAIGDDDNAKKRIDNINAEADALIRKADAQRKEQQLSNYKKELQNQVNLQKQYMQISANLLLAQDKDQQKFLQLQKEGIYTQLQEQQEKVAQMEENNDYNNNTEALKAKEMAELQNSINANSINANLAKNKDGVSNFFGKMGLNFPQQIKQFIAYQLSFRSVFSKLQQGLKTVENQIKSMNKALVDLQIVTGKSKEETQALLTSYSDLGQTLGATTTEVANAANSWLRQGYEAAEVTDLITSSLYLSKLGMIDSATATQNLTSMLKGFKLEASEALSVVDKLVSVDMKAAASAGGIAEALSQFATTAQLSGVDMDRAIAMATTIMDVSQAAPSSAGNAMKTMLSRFGNVKAGSFVSMEDGEEGGNVNDVERVLKPLGISLRTTSTEMRDFSDVLEDVADKWNTLDDVSKNALATAFAGVRQREAFLVLMENMDKYHELIDVSATSAGTATKKYEAYQQSLEASQKKLAASWEELGNNTNLQELLIKFNNFLADLMKAAPKILKWVVRLSALRATRRLGNLAFSSFSNLFGNFSQNSGQQPLDILRGGLSKVGRLGGWDTQNNKNFLNTIKDRVTIIPNKLDQLHNDVVNLSNKTKTSSTGNMSTALAQIDPDASKSDLVDNWQTKNYRYKLGVNESGQQILTRTNGKGKEKLYQFDSQTGQFYSIDKKGRVSQYASVGVGRTYAAHRNQAFNEQYGLGNFNSSKMQIKAIDAAIYNHERANISLNNATTGLRRGAGGNWYAESSFDAKGKLLKGSKAVVTKKQYQQIQNEVAQNQKNIDALNGQKQQLQLSKKSASAGVKAGVIAGLQVGAGAFTGYNTASNYTVAKDAAGNEFNVAMTDQEKQKAKNWGAVGGALSAIPIVGPVAQAIIDKNVENGKLIGGDSRSRAIAEQNASLRKSQIASIYANFDDYQKAVKAGDSVEASEQFQKMFNSMADKENAQGREQLFRILRKRFGDGNDSISSIMLKMNDNIEGQKELSKALLEAQLQAERENIISSNATNLYEAGSTANTAYNKFNGMNPNLTTGEKWGAGAAGAATGALIGGAAGFTAGAGGAALGVAAATLLGYSASVAAIPVAGWVAAAIGATIAAGIGIYAGIQTKKLKKEQEIAETNYYASLTLGDKIENVKTALESETDTKRRMELKGILEELQKANDQLYIFNKQLDENTIKQSLLNTNYNGIDLTDLSTYRLKDLGSAGILKILAKQVKADGGLKNGSVYNSDGTISNYAKSLFEKEIKNNSALWNAYSGNVYTLNEALDDKRAEVLENFANALDVSVAELEGFRDKLGEVELGDFMLSLEELKEKVVTLSNNMSKLIDVNTTQYEKQQLILSEYPDLLSYIGDNSKLLEELNKKQQQEIEVTGTKLKQYVLTDENIYQKNFQEKINESIPKGSIKSDDLLAKIEDAKSVQSLLNLVAGNKNVPNEIQENIINIIKKVTEQLELTVDTNRTIFLSDLEFVNHLLDDQVSNLEKQKSALQEINQQREYENKLLEARNKLETALNEKKRVWREGVGWVYEANQEDIKSAQDELESLTNEKQISELEAQITQLQADKEEITKMQEQTDAKWADLKDSFDVHFKDILGGNASLSSIQKILEGTKVAIEGLKVNLNGEIDENVAGVAKGKEQLRQDLEEAQANLDLWNQRKIETGDEGSSWSNIDRTSYNTALETYNNLVDKAVQTYGDNLGFGRYNLDPKTMRVETKDSEGKQVVYQPDQLTTGADLSKEKFLFARVTEGDYKNSAIMWDPHGRATIDGNPDADWNITEERDLTETLQNKGVSSAWIYGDKKEWYFDGSGFYLASSDNAATYSRYKLHKSLGYSTGISNGGSYTPEGYNGGGNNIGNSLSNYSPSQTGYAQGTTAFKGGAAMINEAGTEAIITPHGTITALPAATGIVPADITKNLWQLGELAPAILNGLLEPGFGFNQTFSGQNPALDESFNIQNLTMNVEADSSFDADAFVQAIKTKAALTKNNR